MCIVFADLIKTDKNSCSITIVLTNRGPTAFKPNSYGVQIQVERHFTQTSSGYKIKNTAGQSTLLSLTSTYTVLGTWLADPQ